MDFPVDRTSYDLFNETCMNYLHNRDGSYKKALQDVIKHFHWELDSVIPYMDLYALEELVYKNTLIGLTGADGSCTFIEIKDKSLSDFAKYLTHFEFRYDDKVPLEVEEIRDNYYLGADSLIDDVVNIKIKQNHIDDYKSDSVYKIIYAPLVKLLKSKGFDAKIV